MQDGSKIVKKVYCHLFIYQNLSINFSTIDKNINFIVVKMPRLDRKSDSSEELELFFKESR